MSFGNALEEFGIALGKLKEAYAEEYYCNSSYLSISADENNYVTIIPTNERGRIVEVFRDWVSIEE